MNRWPIEWIDTADALRELISLFKQEAYLTVDTETVGWETGNERLCLVQIGVPSKQIAFVIDPLAIEDLSPLEPILTGARPVIVAHNAAFESRQFDRHKIKLRGVADTLAMSRELRPDLPNHTLQTCCRQILGLEISKVEQTSDWSKRPLTPEQLAYAALDVEVTSALYEVLKEMSDKLEIDQALSVPDLMQLLAETVRDRLALTKSIAPELSLLSAREVKLRECIKGKLVDGSDGYEGDFGRCALSKIKRTEVNPHKVKSVFPEIAPFVVTESVERKRLLAVMKEYGIDPDRLEEVLDVVGHTDRMSLSVKDISGVSGDLE